MKAHNQGNTSHTLKYKPWRLKTAIAFTDRQKALDFEVYLKSPSGRAFAKKRL
jgi:predicted GIY-YIG superfamily endonuclease